MTGPWSSVMVFKPTTSSKYAPLPLNDEESLEKTSPTWKTGFREKTQRWKAYTHSLSWILSITFAMATVSLLTERHQIKAQGSFSSGWPTDFAPARKEIEVQEITFGGSISFFDNNTMYIPHPDPTKYVGEPSPEIDANWDTLTWGRYILITEAEAHEAWGPDISQYWDADAGGYKAGLDMFHTLHCLDQLRKILHQDYYGPIITSPNQRLHQWHCIEQLRQYVMCSGDMTPIPTRYYGALGRNYVDSDVPHTCRNFGKLQRWMLDRYDGPSAVKPETAAIRI